MHAGARRRFVVPPELGKSGPCIGFPCFTFSSEGKGGGRENQSAKAFSHTHTHTHTHALSTQLRPFPSTKMVY